MPQVFRLPDCITASGLQNTFPIFLSDTFWRACLWLRQGGFHGRIQLLRPGCQTPRLLGRDQLGLQTLQIGPLKQGICFDLFSLSNDLTMRTHPTPYLGLRRHFRIMRHPAQQALGRAKGQFLRQDAHPFLQPPRRHLSFMFRQASIARQRVRIFSRPIANLPRQLQDPQSAGDLQRIMPVTKDNFRMLLAKPLDQKTICQSPLLYHQRTHGFPAQLHYGAFQSVQVLLRCDRRNIDTRHLATPKLLHRVRIVKLINLRYHHYQLAHMGLPMIALRRCEDIEDTRMGQFLSRARPIGLAR